MNILFLDQFSDMGGAQRCLLDLLPGVREHSWNAHVAAPGNGALLEACKAQGATVSALPLGSYSNGRKSAVDVLRFARDSATLAGRIRALAEECRAGLLYVNGPRLLPAAAWAARDRLPLVFHCHSYLVRRYAAWLARRSLALARARVIACSSFVARPLMPFSGPLQVIYNGVPPGIPRRGEFPQGDRWRIGVIGRIAPEKGQAEFLRAARLLSGCSFVVCGAPRFAPPRYGAMVAQLAAGLDIEFTGWTEDPGAVLRSLDLLVVPSMAHDATPRVMVEAWAAGVPIVAFASGGINELVVDGETGFLVGPRTPGALAERIGAILRSPAQLRTVAANAHAVWRDRFTVERYRSEVFSVFTVPLSGPPACNAGFRAGISR